MGSCKSNNQSIKVYRLYECDGNKRKKIMNLCKSNNQSLKV